MAIDRRRWLTQVGAAASVLAWPGLALATPGATSALRLLSAWSTETAAWVGVWTPGNAPLGLQLPARAHELLPVPGQPHQALAVARRPGDYLVRFDTRKAQVLQWHDMEDDRYLAGHALFSADGQTLYTTETDGNTGAGLLVARDPFRLTRRSEAPTGGIGPHALLLEPQGTLLIANGGLLNLPETGRRKRNRDRMDPSLVRLDPGSGQILATWRLDDPFLSLRHLAIAHNGTVAIGLQAEHADNAQRRAAPLLALLESGTLRAVGEPSATQDQDWLEGYAGDVTWLPGEGDSREGRFLVSATQAGVLASWSVAGQALQRWALPQAGALAVHPQGWLASGALGHLHGVWGGQETSQQLKTIRWDNHARLLG